MDETARAPDVAWSENTDLIALASTTSPIQDTDVQLILRWKFFDDAI